MEIRYAKKEDLDVIVEQWWLLHLYQITELNGAKDLEFTSDAKRKFVAFTPIKSQPKRF